MDQLTIFDSATLINGWIVKDPFHNYWILRLRYCHLFIPYDSEYLIPDWLSYKIGLLYR